MRYSRVYRRRWRRGRTIDNRGDVNAPDDANGFEVEGSPMAFIVEGGAADVDDGADGEGLSKNKTKKKDYARRALGLGKGQKQEGRNRCR